MNSESAINIKKNKLNEFVSYTNSIENSELNLRVENKKIKKQNDILQKDNIRLRKRIKELEKVLSGINQNQIHLMKYA